MTDKTIEKYFADWESEFFGFGYGTGEPHTLRALKSFLEAIPDQAFVAYHYEDLEQAVGADVCWLLINILGGTDIIEYGTSPRRAWLTEQGLALRRFVESKTVSELVDIVCIGEHDHCTPSHCNCGPKGYSEVKLCKNPFWENKK